MQNIPFITDCVFSFFTTLVLSFVLLSYYLAMPYTLILSLLLSVVALIIIGRILKRRREKAYATKAQKELFFQTLFSLNLMKTCELSTYFVSVYSAVGVSAVKKRNCLYLEEKNKHVFFAFNFTRLTKCDIVKVYNQIGKDGKAEILTEDCDEDVINFAKRFKNIEISCAKKVFSLIDKAQVFPPILCPQIENKQKTGVNLKNLLKKEKSKNFFFLGLTFLFMSFLVGKKTYYVIFGGVFLIYSLILRIYGKDKKESPDHLD